MITIKKMKEELAKFPNDCVCFAYEGEVTGLIIQKTETDYKTQGVIFCSEGQDEDKETIFLAL